MENLELYLIDNSINIENREGLSTRLRTMLLSGLLCCGVFVLFKDLASPLVFVLTLLAFNYLLYPLVRKSLGDWLNSTDVIGKVRFEENSIRAAGKVVHLDDIDSIHLVGDYYQGCLLSHRDYWHNGLYSIRIHKKSGEIFEFKFVVFTKSEYDSLVDFFKHVYSKFTIKIEEKIGAERFGGLLLSHVRSYREIQKLKADFRLTKQIV